MTSRPRPRPLPGRLHRPARRVVRVVLVVLAALCLLLPGCSRSAGTTYSADDVPGTTDPSELLGFFDDSELVAGEGTTGTTYEYVGQRVWDAPGWVTLMARLDLATTSEDVVAGLASAPERSAQVAARVLTYLAERDDVAELPEALEGEAAAHLAHVVSTYAIALPLSLYSTADMRPSLFTPFSDTFGGSVEHVPLLTRDTVAGVLGIVVASDEGLRELRAGMNAARAAFVAALGEQLRRGASDNPLAASVALVDDDLYVESLVLQQLRSDPRRTPEERDERVRWWIRAGEAVFDRAAALEAGSDRGRPDGETLTGLVVRPLGSQGPESAVADDLGADEVALEQIGALQEWYLLASVVERGDGWRAGGRLDAVRPGGALVSWEELSVSGEAEQEAFVDQVTDPGSVRGFGPVESIVGYLADSYGDLTAPVEDD